MSARIVQVANFYSRQSGGLRTAVEAAAQGYRAAGHEVVLIVPGADHTVTGDTVAGERITIRAPRLPGGPYRMIVNWSRLTQVIKGLNPDRLEVSDKLTLAPLGRWAGAQGIPALLWSHERIDAILAPRLPGWAPLPRAADAANRRYLAWFDTIACSSAFAAAEFERLGATDHGRAWGRGPHAPEEGGDGAPPGKATVVRVPLGVDLKRFVPRLNPAGDGPIQLICVGRLSVEKGAELAVAAVRQLRRAGRDVQLTLVGDGPYRTALERQAKGLPVHFAGHLASRADVARRLAAADVAIAPCQVESFGLAVLEALACGTPVVAVNRGAAPELLAPGCGLATAPYGHTLAAAVDRVLSWPVDRRRRAARARAEQFPWSVTVAALLAAHGLPSEGALRWVS